MKFFSDCSGECCVCRCGDGGCLAGHGDDDFCLASKEEIVKRLDEGKYKSYTNIMIGVLKDKYGYEYKRDNYMKVYIVEIHDYDGYDSKGYFTEYGKAVDCCNYLNMITSSPYGYTWNVKEYDFDETDYYYLIKELFEQERLENEKELERIKQEELKELARLKAKYELN